MSRTLKLRERSFIKMILKNNSEAKYLLPYLSKYLVEEMEDGSMGGLKFISEKKDRHLGKKIASFDFIDEDDVPVSVTLNVDNYGDLYELDIWKIDFSPLKSLPNYSKKIKK